MRHRLCQIGILLFTFILSNLSYAEKVTWENLESNYQKTWKAVEHGLTSEELKELKKFHVILVPGFLSDIVIEFGKFLGEDLKDAVQVGEYFDDQIDYLSKNGIDYEKLNIESEESPDHNAKIIREAIEKTPENKRVILITHSKGGVDTLHALLSEMTIGKEKLSLKKLWKKKIAGWISIQSAFGGSKIADLIDENPVLKKVIEGVLKLNGGSISSIDSLTHDNRRAFLSKNEKQIDLLLRNLPMINYASYIDKGDGAKTGLWLTRDLIRDKNLKATRNDGLVSMLDAILSTSSFYGDYIIEKNIDHAVPVMPSHLLGFDRKRFTRTLLSLLLQKL